jgi:HSP20 family protein
MNQVYTSAANVPQQQFWPSVQSGWGGIQSGWGGFSNFAPVSTAYSYRFQPFTSAYNPAMTTGMADQYALSGGMPYAQAFAPNVGGYGTGATTFGRTSFGLSQPDIDISETKNDIVLACDLPNVNLNDLNLTVSENTCTISAQSWIGGQSLALHRTIPLPTSIRAEAVDTNYSNGILQVRMPKKDITARRQISVNMSQ